MRYAHHTCSLAVVLALVACAEEVGQVETPIVVVTPDGPEHEQPQDDAGAPNDPPIVGNRRDAGPIPPDAEPSGDAAPKPEDPPPDAGTPVDPDTPALRLRIRALDIWAQALPAYDLDVVGPGGRVAAERDGRFSLPRAGHYSITLEADDHHGLELGLDYDGDLRAETVEVEAPFGEVAPGLAVRRDGDTLELFCGLQHRWFAATGRPARRGNHVELLMDGEQSWRRVHERLTAARRTIHASTWWWQSDFELIRSDVPEGTGLRRRNTIMSLLEASPATKRVLVYQSLVLGLLNVDDALEAHGARDDDIEYMGQENPTVGRFFWEMPTFFFGDRVAEMTGADPRGLDLEAPIESDIPGRVVDLELTPLDLAPALGSYHQKFFVFDGEDAFVGGMNVKATDWDTSDHDLFDARRMNFESSVDARREVAALEREPDLGPRKDYMVHVRGPASQDVEETFALRWRHQLDQAVENAENATDFDIERDLPEVRGGLQVQVVNSMPEPFHEYSIYESHVNAVRAATEYILVEDQYWRAPDLVDEIIVRMEQVPTLQLVVVTNPVSEWTDPGCFWTAETHAWLSRRFPDRYTLLQLRVFLAHETWGFDEMLGDFVGMDLHSKIMVVDDVFVSVGSCNKNNRGYVYEGETNVNVLDEDFATDTRRRIVSNMVGVAPGALAADWIGALHAAARRNDAAYAAWEDEGFDLDLDGAPVPAAYQPRGFVYSLDFRDSAECLLESVGPDIANQPQGHP